MSGRELTDNGKNGGTNVRQFGTGLHRGFQSHHLSLLVDIA
jgi:hypothetical protein